MEEEFYIGTTNNKNGIKGKKIKVSTIKVIKIVSIIMVCVFILLTIGYKIYRRTLLRYNEFEASVLEQEQSNLKVVNNENYTLISLNVDEYFRKQVSEKKAVIDLTTSLNNDNRSLTLNIYDDKTFLYTEVKVIGNKRKKITRVGKIDIDFDEFKKVLLNIRDIFKFDYSEDNIIIENGIFYYDANYQYFLDEHVSSFKEIEQYVLNLEMKVEKENVIEGK